MNYELHVWTASRVDTHHAFRSDLNFAAFRDHGLVTPDPPPTPAPPPEEEEPPDPELL